MVKSKKYILIVCALLLLASGCRMSSKEQPKPVAVPKPVSGDYAVITDINNDKYYLVTEPGELERLFLLLPSAVSLKDHPSHSIHVVEDGLYKEGFDYFDDLSLYAEWDRQAPEELAAYLGTLLDDAHQAAHYRFYSDDPNHHQALMEELGKEEGLLFYYPSYDTDRQRSSVTLYYECTDKSLTYVGSAPLGDLPADDVFIPAADFLAEKGLLYKSLDVSFSSSSREDFGRRAELLLTYPLDQETLDEIARLLEDSTGKEPYIINGRPSGAFLYSEEPPYPIDMVSKRAVPDKRITRLKEKYKLQ